MSAIIFDEASFSSILLDTVGALIVVLDEKGRVLQFNRACEQLSGYTFEEVRGSKIERFLPRTEIPQVRKVIQRLLDGETPIYHQNYWLTKNGELRWIEWSNSALVGKDGKYHFVLATGIDVTERNNKEKALEDSERRFSYLFRSSPAPVLITTVKTNCIMDINPRFEELTGYSRDELISQDPEQMGIIIVDHSSFKINRGIKSNPDLVEGDVQVFTRDGRTFHMIASTVQIFLGAEECLLSALQDITARKHYEEQVIRLNAELEERVKERTIELEAQVLQRSILQEKINQLLRVSPVVIVSALPGEPYTITYVSDNIEALYGYPKDALVNRPRIWKTLLHPDDYAKRVERIAQLEKTGVLEYEARFRKADGDYRYVRLAFKMIHDETGRSIELHAAILDISAQREVEQGLHLALQKEKEVNEMQADFVAMISHQVGTPLSAILSSAEMLEHYGESWPSDRRLKHLHRIIDSSKRVDAIVKDILHIGRIDAINIRNDEHPVDMVALCASLVDTFRVADRGNHPIRLNAPDVPVTCFLDEHLAIQTLENVMSNALKYSDEGSEIVVDVWIAQEQVHIQVKDQGIGISKQDLKRIGTPFFRGKNALQTPGTGLGLTLVKRSVEAVGGHLQIISEENRGTIVHIQFPAFVDLTYQPPQAGMDE